MDHNLEDSLTLEGDMETVTMDFEHSEDVVSHEDIIIEESRLEGVSMHIDEVGEHATLMETSNEVIVSNFMEESFPFHEYTIQHDSSSGSNITINPNQLNQLTMQNEPIIKQNTEEQSLLKLTNTPGVSNVVTLKVAQTKPTKRAIAPAPREVAIAPKPPPVQYNIAPKPTPTKSLGLKPMGLKPVGSKPMGLKTMGPKPVALITNRSFIGTGKQPKSIEDLKSDTIITQIGSKIMMMPKKIKLMSSTSSDTSGIQYTIQCPSDQGQIIGNAKGKPVMKFIQIQGQSSGTEQMAGAAATSRAQAPRYVMQQKTVPISMAGPKVVQNIKIGGNKQQIIAVKSQSPKVVAVSQGSANTNKVLISANSNPKVLIRTSAPTSTTQVFKDAGQRTQLHPINVPGKGIQYIKLVTSQPTPKTTAKTVAAPSKNFVFTDKKGNVIQMRAEKVAGAKQPPPLVFAGIGPGNKGTMKTQPMTLKTERKLVRIAPVTKTTTQSTPQTVRSSQSLLAPMTTLTTTSVATKMSPIASTSSDVKEVSLEEFNEMVERSNLSNVTDDYAVVESQVEEITTEVEHEQNVDMKPTLQSLISDAVSEEGAAVEHSMEHLDVEVELDKKCETIRNASFVLREEKTEHNTSNTSDTNKEEFIISTSQANDSVYSNDSQADYSENTSYLLREDGTFERDSSDISGSHKQSVLIVPGATHNDTTYSSDLRYVAEGRKTRYISIEAECDPYNMSSNSPPTYSEDVELGMRPRKPCNCTKSQCLKLYCDCFANGEFCNQCNCNNCHNNLENEDVRQKAIRSCLERNPNAFRPKIGKSRGGPEIIRRHTKGCNCKRSGCLKKYCECYEAKIACTAMCKCVGCRNIEATLVRRRDAIRLREKLNDSNYRPATAPGPPKQPCSFMTTEVIEAVCQCLIAAAGGGDDSLLRDIEVQEPDPVQDVIEEFARCLQDVISASHHEL